MYEYAEVIVKAADDIESTFGTGGIILLIFLQALQIIVAVLPGGFVEVVGGIIYGVGKGLAISSIGIFSGSMAAFLIAKKLGRRLVIKIAGKEKFERYEKLLKRNKLKGFIYLFFFLPGVPKDVLIYVIGIASDYKMALTASLLRIPSTIVTVFAGSIFGSGDLVRGAVIYFSFILIGVIGVYIHNKIIKDKDDPA